MRKTIRDTFELVKVLRLARENMVAAWPSAFYKREFISERILGGRLYIVNCPEGVEHVFVKNAQNYSKSPLNTATLKPLLGRGLFVSEPPLWTRQRKVMTPALAHSRLADYGRMVITAGSEMIEAWTARGPAPFEVDVNEPFTLMTAEIISRIMFGYTLGAKGVTLYEAFKEYQASAGRVHIGELFGFPSWLPRPGQFRGRNAVKKFDSVLLEIIQAGKARGQDESGDLLQMLLAYRDEKGLPMSPDLVRDEVASIFLAGHETTAITLAWAFYLIDGHSDAREMLHSELDRVLEGRTPAYEDVEKLVYCRAVIEETLRLYPPVHIFSRRALADDVVCGHPIPKGAYVTAASWLLHRHRMFWEAPSEFRPARFLPENVHKIDRFAYIPFGTGPRVCLGKHLGLLEATLLLAMIAQRFRLRLVPGHVVEPLGRMTLRPRNGMLMRVEPRPS
jgi:cytochrome P450